MIRGHYFYVHLRTRIVLPLAPILSFKLSFSSNPKNPDHWKSSGPQGKIESIQRRNYSDQLRVTVSWVEYEQKKGEHAGNPGWKAVDKEKFFIGTTIPNLQKYKKKIK